MSTVASPGASRSRWKLLALRMSLLGFTLLIVAAGLEIGTRLAGGVNPPLTERDAAIGQRFIKDFQGRAYDREAQREVPLRFNNVGFRGPDRPFAKPQGTRRIAVLGDSMVAGLAVDEDKTMVRRLEEQLNRTQPECRWEVLNFGVPGASTGQELVLYRELVSRFEPDIVLCAFFVGNDLSDNSRRLSNNPRIYFDLDEAGQLWQVPFSAARAGFSSWLNRYSRFYVWQREAVNRMRYAMLKQTHQLEPGQWIYCKSEPGDVGLAWKLTGQLICALRDEAVKRGALFAVTVIPASPQIYADSFQKIASLAGDQASQFDADHPDRRLAELCRLAGVPLLTMTKDFRALAPSASEAVEAEWLFNQGTGHFNERGNELAAQVIHRFLTEGSASLADRRPLVKQLR